MAFSDGFSDRLFTQDNTSMRDDRPAAVHHEKGNKSLQEAPTPELFPEIIILHSSNIKPSSNAGNRPEIAPIRNQQGKGTEKGAEAIKLDTQALRGQTSGNDKRPEKDEADRSKDFIHDSLKTAGKPHAQPPNLTQTSKGSKKPEKNPIKDFIHINLKAAEGTHTHPPNPSPVSKKPEKSRIEDLFPDVVNVAESAHVQSANPPPVSKDFKKPEKNPIKDFIHVNLKAAEDTHAQPPNHSPPSKGPEKLEANRIKDRIHDIFKAAGNTPAQASPSFGDPHRNQNGSPRMQQASRETGNGKGAKEEKAPHRIIDESQKKRTPSDKDHLEQAARAKKPNAGLAAKQHEPRHLHTTPMIYQNKPYEESRRPDQMPNKNTSAAPVELPTSSRNSAKHREARPPNTEQPYKGERHSPRRDDPHVHTHPKDFKPELIMSGALPDSESDEGRSPLRRKHRHRRKRERSPPRGRSRRRGELRGRMDGYGENDSGGYHVDRVVIRPRPRVQAEGECCALM